MQGDKIFIFFIVLSFIILSVTACAHDDICITTMSNSEEADEETDEGEDESEESSIVSESNEPFKRSSEIEESAFNSTSSDAVSYVYVYVCGSVNREGVYQLRDGDRIDDALRSAGGYSENAAKAVVNLAAKVIDGQKIYFPSVDEIEDGTYVPDSENLSGENCLGNGTSVNDGSSNGIGSASGLVNINIAGKDELMTLSGIGESKAEDIISYREMYGAFGSIEDIKNVSGIGDATFEKLKSHITVTN